MTSYLDLYFVDQFMNLKRLIDFCSFLFYDMYFSNWHYQPNRPPTDLEKEVGNRIATFMYYVSLSCFHHLLLTHSCYIFLLHSQKNIEVLHLASSTTVNSEIFAKLRICEVSLKENSRNSKITLSFTDNCKSCLSRKL